MRKRARNQTSLVSKTRPKPDAKTRPKFCFREASNDHPPPFVLSPLERAALTLRRQIGYLETHLADLRAAFAAQGNILVLWLTDHGTEPRALAEVIGLVENELAALRRKLAAATEGVLQ